jgi:hypothetical protein
LKKEISELYDNFAKESKDINKMKEVSSAEKPPLKNEPPMKNKETQENKKELKDNLSKEKEENGKD